MKIFFGRSKYQKDVVLQQRKQFVSYHKSQEISHTFLSSAHLLAICSLRTLEALYDGGRIMTRDNTEWGPFTRKFKTLCGFVRHTLVMVYKGQLIRDIV